METSRLSTKDIRIAIRGFNKAFGRPVNTMPADLTVTERELLAKLLIEEAVESVVLGLGCDVKIDVEAGRPIDEQYIRVEHREGVLYDPIEYADGMGDVNVVIHFSSHWAGFNLDRITHHINDSNMSKTVDGKALINGETPGYREHEPGFDPAKPIGKILKGPNFWDAKPGIVDILKRGNY